MATVAQILKTKANPAVHMVAPGTSVIDALRQMAEKNIGALLVGEGGKVAGIFTERDYARKIALMGKSSRDTPLHEVMTTEVLFVRPDQTSEECMALMTENRMRHLPVMDKGKLAGLVSIGDLVKDVISEQKFLIEQLEQYIAR
ncbi:MAG: CBS domain-containing protein [Burkholderiales bacterium]